MITRSQLEVVARREGIALPAVERDYIQHVLLRHAAGPPLVFTGGTCLRIAYGSPRYSEDLDFNADTDARGAFDHLVTSSARLPNYGMPATVVRRPSREGLAAVLHCEGPLFSGNPRSRASVRIEVSLRHEPVATAEVFVPRTPYADVPQLVLRTLSKEHLFAEKVRALVVRGKPRDLYDVHFLLTRGFSAPRKLLDLKMSLYRRSFSPTGLERGIVSAGRGWERDLEPLLGQVPPFEAVAGEVRSRLRKVHAGRD